MRGLAERRGPWDLPESLIGSAIHLKGGGRIVGGGQFDFPAEQLDDVADFLANHDSSPAGYRYPEFAGIGSNCRRKSVACNAPSRANRNQRAALEMLDSREAAVFVW
jgi:hypothetical protein